MGAMIRKLVFDLEEANKLVVRFLLPKNYVYARSSSLF